MIDLIPVRLRIVVATAIAAGWVTETHPQEKVTPRAATEHQDAIAGAKKDFEGLKSVRDAALLPQGGLPRVTLPEMNAPAPAPSVSIGTKPKIPPRDSKSGSWLVDAMEKQNDSRNLREPDSRSRERQGKSPLRDKNSEANELETGRSREGREENDQSGAAAVINPLTRYLGDWMTPQDYALLKPGLTESLNPGLDPKGITGLATPGPATTAAGLTGSVLGAPPGTQPVFAPQTPRENPYLQTIAPDPSANSITAGAKSLPPPPMPSAVSRPTIMPPPPIAPAQTKIPEFAKPPTDEKYFKQLKRF